MMPPSNQVGCCFSSRIRTSSGVHRSNRSSKSLSAVTSVVAYNLIVFVGFVIVVLLTTTTTVPSSSSSTMLPLPMMAVSAFRRSTTTAFTFGRYNFCSRSASSVDAFAVSPPSSSQHHYGQRRRATAASSAPFYYPMATGRFSLSSMIRYSSTTTSETTTSSSSSALSSPDCHDYDLHNAAKGLPSDSSYDPSSFESVIYQWWETSGCFDPDATKSKRIQRRQQQQQQNQQQHAGGTQDDSKNNDKEEEHPYVLPMPPPNVTGRLHMGHAIFVALQDVLARFHRMRGKTVLWTPGTDHAGIATQLQVEKLLVAEGRRRASEEEIAEAISHGADDETMNKLVGRTEFLEKVWEYKAEQGGAITSQLRSLGASADWKRERFTMDPDLCVGVTEAFVRLYEKGLIYRGTYMVNWSPGLMTAVSDLEVEYTEEEGKLYYFKYMVDKGEGGGGEEEEYLPVATTRPETIFGDTAVCVNPNDERYKHLIGKRVLVPMSSSSSNNGNKESARSIPIIADEYVDMEFGTGALKITPGHDPNDYDLGKKYNLEIRNIMNKDATMNSACGERYVGMDRFDARSQLWKDMEESNLTLKVEAHTQRVPRSQRGGEIIEPLVSKQWFVKTENMGAKALEAVQSGDIRIVPSRFEKVWYGWLTNIRDW
jgi:valyl-tRNA synthetase